ncbi:MAG TPA: PilZ domain-containing protein [Polyangiaceae bacterium]|nr:PilZ domain-containing protein [Polyangiaceae bacterium]
MQEKRVHPRSPLRIPVTCELPGQQSITGDAKDVSLGGMFIEAPDASPPFGTAITVVCELPGLDREARLPAVVRWTKAGGFGVQFGLLGARETHAITRLPRS